MVTFERAFLKAFGSWMACQIPIYRLAAKSVKHCDLEYQKIIPAVYAILKFQVQSNTINLNRNYFGLP